MPFSEITMATATCGKDYFFFLKIIRLLKREATFVLKWAVSEHLP